MEVNHYIFVFFVILARKSFPPEIAEVPICIINHYNKPVINKLKMNVFELFKSNFMLLPP